MPKSSTTKTSQEWENIIKRFVSSLEKKTGEQYKQVTNALQTKGAFPTDAEKMFIEICPKLISEGRKDDLLKLIGLLKKSVYMYVWGGNQKSYKTYCIAFIDFLEKKCKSTSKKKNFEDLKRSMSTKSCSTCGLSKLTVAEEYALNSALDEHKIFLHEILHTKFKARLRRQDRTSGDKVWLPLSFIAKLYRHKESKAFTGWLDELVNGIYIHYEDTSTGKSTIQSVQLNSKQVFLELEKNTAGEYDVYVIWSRKEGDSRKRVLTPTGEGNKKVLMTVSDISEIDIDHVKPIDATLRDLENKFDVLQDVSDAYKMMLEAKSQPDADEVEVENQAINDLLTRDSELLEKLTQDLGKIKNDGPLRLMSAKYNEKKSNASSFEKIIKTKNGEYLGLMGTATLDSTNKPVWIYQNLEENGVNRATEVKPSGRTVKITKKNINLV